MTVARGVGRVEHRDGDCMKYASRWKSFWGHSGWFWWFRVVSDDDLGVSYLYADSGAKWNSQSWLKKFTRLSSWKRFWCDFFEQKIQKLIKVNVVRVKPKLSPQVLWPKLLMHPQKNHFVMTLHLDGDWCRTSGWLASGKTLRKNRPKQIPPTRSWLMDCDAVFCEFALSATFSIFSSAADSFYCLLFFLIKQLPELPGQLKSFAQLFIEFH